MAEEVYIAHALRSPWEDVKGQFIPYKLTRLDRATGQKIWETGWKWELQRLLVTEDTVLVIVHDDSYAVDSGTGEIRWGPKDVWLRDASGNTVLAEYVIKGRGGRMVYGLDVRTGEELWAKDDSLPVIQQIEFKGDTAYEFQRKKGGGSSADIYAIGPSGTVGPIGTVGGSGSSYYLTARDVNSGEVLWREWFGGDERQRSERFEFGTKNGAYWEVEDDTIRYIDFRSGDDICTWNMTGGIGELLLDSEHKLAIAHVGSGELVALQATGGELWRFRDACFREDERWVGVDRLLGIHDSQVFAIATIDRMVEHGSIRGHFLYSLNVHSGEVMWRIPIEASYTFRAIRDGVIFFSEYINLGDRTPPSGFDVYSCNLHAFDTQSGEEKWNLSLPMLWSPSLLGTEYDTCLVGDTIYIRVPDSLERGEEKPNFLIALRVDTGQMKWYYKTNGTVRSHLWVDNGSVYFWTEHSKDTELIYGLHCIIEKD